MNLWLVYSIGFMAQLLFSARFVVQWLQSEKRKRVVTPSIFWKLSLIASVLLFVYGYFRKDFAIMFGQTITYFIYIRNLSLQGNWHPLPKIIKAFILSFPLLIGLMILLNGDYHFNDLFMQENIQLWLVWLGVISQLLFTLRFVYQWLYSEQTAISQLPLGFWILSCIGASLILVYAIYRSDPVLLIAHIVGIAIYVRNIYLLKSLPDERT